MKEGIEKRTLEEKITLGLSLILLSYESLIKKEKETTTEGREMCIRDRNMFVSP